MSTLWFVAAGMVGLGLLAAVTIIVLNWNGARQHIEIEPVRINEEWE